MYSPRNRLLASTAAASILSLLAAWCLAHDARLEAGTFSYAMDDTYIHMAMARSLAEQGIWGVRDTFASASSSPIWVGLLAGVYWVAGTNETAPLMLNAIAGLGVLVAAGAVARSWGLAHAWLAPILVALAVPLPAIGLLGLEHVLHTALVLALLALVGRRPTSPNAPTTTDALLLTLATVLPLVRYESLALLASAAALLWFARARTVAVAMALAAFTSVFAFGMWNQAQGGLLLPNSVVMKSLLPHDFVPNLLSNARQAAGLWLLVGAAAVGAMSRGLDDRYRQLCALFAVCAVAQLTLSRVGSYYRYEAYLAAWGAVVLLALAPPAWMHRRWAILGLLAASVVPNAQRTSQAMRYYQGRVVYIADAKARFAEAIEAAGFESVATHDIGALAWSTELDIADVAGLASNTIAAIHNERQLGPEHFAALAENRRAHLAYAGPDWMTDDLPPGWQPVADIRWRWGPYEHTIWIVYQLTPAPLDLSFLDQWAQSTNNRGAWAPR